MPYKVAVEYSAKLLAVLVVKAIEVIAAVLDHRLAVSHIALIALFSVTLSVDRLFSIEEV
jgi:hypothetical protein